MLADLHAAGAIDDREFASAKAVVLGGGGAAVRTTAGAWDAPQPVPRRHWPWLVAAAVVVLLAAGLVILQAQPTSGGSVVGCATLTAVVPLTTSTPVYGSDGSPIGDPPSLDEAVAVSADGRLVYAANDRSQSLDVINTSSGTMVASVALSSPRYDIVLAPDGSRAYVTNWTNETLSVVDTVSNAVIASVVVGDVPAGIALTPNGARAYVAVRDSDFLAVVDTASLQVTQGVQVGATPLGVEITGNRAYVANAVSDSLSVIDTTSNLVVDTIPVGDYPVDLAITPDGSRAFVAASGSGYPGSSPGVTVVDLATGTVVGFVALTHYLSDLALTADGRRLLVTHNAMTGVHGGALSVIDTDSLALVEQVALDRPGGIVSSPDGRCAYVNTAGSDGLSTVSPS
ncbi:hypothetical protein ACVGOW_21445 [Pseudonocardia saturnea]